MNWSGQPDGFSLCQSGVLTGNRGEVLGYEYDLSPIGYLVLSADQSLPQVIAYSFTSDFSVKGEIFNPLRKMLTSDLGIRMEYLYLLPEDEKERNRLHWAALLEAVPGNRLFGQWPPPGSTSLEKCFSKNK